MSAPREYDVIVVGGGNAAGYVAKAHVDLGSDLSLAIVSSEPVAPYERPALSKGFLFGKAKLPGFHTSVGGGGERQDPDWYDSHNIGLHLGKRITTLDAQAKVLTDEDGQQYLAKKAIIAATGSSTIQLTRSPGHDLQGIHYLRELDDADGLLAAIQGKPKSCVIVGGGYIGMEVAAAVSSQGIPVTMVFPEEWLFQRLFSQDMAKLYTEAYSKAGVTMVTGMCSEFVGTGSVQGVMLKGGEVIEGDLVVVGVGARPNTQIFEDQLEIANRPVGGIKVNAQLESSVPGIYAIGDVCAFPVKMYGDRLQRVEHVTHARSSAKHAVGAIHGEQAEYDYLPHFYSRVYDFSWKFWGDMAGDIVTVGNFEPKLLAAWVKDGTFQGGFLESGSDEEFETLRKAALARGPIDPAALGAAGSVEEALKLLVV